MDDGMDDGMDEIGAPREAGRSVQRRRWSTGVAGGLMPDAGFDAGLMLCRE
jgi:hypothetical protein